MLRASPLRKISPVQTFPSYHAAARAFVAAQRANDNAALVSILGAKAQDLLTSGDPAQDEAARASFVKQFDEAHSFVHVAPDKVMLLVGATTWELPFPIEHVGRRVAFRRGRGRAGVGLSAHRTK